MRINISLYAQPSMPGQGYLHLNIYTHNPAHLSYPRPAKISKQMRNRIDHRAMCVNPRSRLDVRACAGQDRWMRRTRSIGWTDRLQYTRILIPINGRAPRRCCTAQCRLSIFANVARPTTLQNMQCGSCLIVFRVWIRRLCGDCFYSARWCHYRDVKHGLTTCVEGTYVQ